MVNKGHTHYHNSEISEIDRRNGCVSNYLGIYIYGSVVHLGKGRQLPFFLLVLFFTFFELFKFYLLHCTELFVTRSKDLLGYLFSNARESK